MDDGKASWRSTLSAFIKHFESEKVEHYYLRRIDLITMLHLIESRGSIEPLTEQLNSDLSVLVYNPPFIDLQLGIEKLLKRSN